MSCSKPTGYQHPLVCFKNLVRYCDQKTLYRLQESIENQKKQALKLFENPTTVSMRTKAGSAYKNLCNTQHDLQMEMVRQQWINSLQELQIVEQRIAAYNIAAMDAYAKACYEDENKSFAIYAEAAANEFAEDEALNDDMSVEDHTSTYLHDVDYEHERKVSEKYMKRSDIRRSRWL